VPRKLRCVLLCEDLEQERLFRPILEKLFGDQTVRVLRGKKTGGFTFVFNTALAKEAKYVRQRPQEAVGLLVVVDGDQVGRKGRLDQIQEVLRLAGFETRDKMPDRIAACIPSRNVETWELWLCGFRDLDEHTDYKVKLQRELKNIRRSQLLEAWLFPSDEQLQAEERTLPALAHGRAEIDRLKKLAKS
jgi:hypothetical protein